MSDILQLIREQHSARVPFDRARPIPPDGLRLILEAARWAPIAHNMQNFEVDHYVRVRREVEDLTHYNAY